MKALTDRQRSYIEYLNSSDWTFKRLEALKRDGYKCRICNSEKKLLVHHRKYPKELGAEPIEDLTTLCSKCHDLYHIRTPRQEKVLTPGQRHARIKRQKKKDLKQKAKKLTPEYFKSIRKY